MKTSVPTTSLSRLERRARWNTRNVEWNAFSAAVGEAIELFSPAPIALHVRTHRFNSALLAAAELHVGKSKAGRYSKPWSTPELREALKKGNALRRTITDNRAEYLEACTATRKLSQEARQKKWEEFLADLTFDFYICRYDLFFTQAFSHKITKSAFSGDFLRLFSS